MKRLLTTLLTLCLLVPFPALALQLNGTSDYLDTTQSAPFNFANATFTVTGWIKTTVASANTAVIIGKTNSGAVSGWDLRIASGQINLLVKSSDGSNSILRLINTVVNDGKWHFFAVVVTTNTATPASQSATMYLDGRLDQSSITLGALGYNASNTTLKIGANGVAARYFPGNIEDIRIYNRGLTQSEVRVLQYGGDIRSGLTAEWKLIGNATNFYEPDVSGSGYFATSTSNIVKGPLSPFLKFRR